MSYAVQRYPQCVTLEQISLRRSQLVVKGRLLTKMRLMVTIFIAFCAIKKSIEKLEHYEKREVPKDHVSCMETVVKQYHAEHKNVMIFSRDSENIVNSLFEIPIVVANEWDFLRKTLTVERGAVIIFLEGNPENDLNGLKRLRDSVVIRSVLMVCVTDPICDSETYKKTILETLEVEHLHYLTVDDEGTYGIYAGTIHTEEICGVPQLVRIGKCSEGLTAKELFHPIVNFHGCPLRAITWTCPPFSRPCPRGMSLETCGLESIIIRILAGKVNATPVLLTVHDPADVRNLVANRYGDIGYGKLDMRPSEGIAYSMPSFFVEATVIAPYSTWVVEGSIVNVLLPFEEEVWVGISVVMVLILILAILVPYFRRIHTLQLFGLILAIPVPRTPGKLPIQIYFISVILFGYFCTQSYLTHLTQALLTYEGRMLESLDDLENSDLQVTGFPEASNYFKDDYPRIYSEFQTQGYPEYYSNLFQLLKGHSESVFYIEILDEYIAEWKHLRALENGISWYPVAMVVPNTSIVIKAARKILPCIFESGLALRSIDIYAKLNGSSEYPDVTSHGQDMVLRFEDLKGVFCLFIAGLGLSLFVFLIELLVPFIKIKMGLKSGGKICPKLFG